MPRRRPADKRLKNTIYWRRSHFSHTKYKCHPPWCRRQKVLRDNAVWLLRQMEVFQRWLSHYHSALDLCMIFLEPITSYDRISINIIRLVMTGGWIKMKLIMPVTRSVRWWAFARSLQSRCWWIKYISTFQLSCLSHFGTSFTLMRLQISLNCVCQGVLVYAERLNKIDKISAQKYAAHRSLTPSNAADASFCCSAADHRGDKLTCVATSV